MDNARRDIWIRPLLTWAALCGLLALTCALAFTPLGRGNLAVSLGIAAVKACLVGVVFMRLFEKNSLNRLAAMAGPVWIFIMFLLMFSDYATR
jgi:caa(3)-type oxidase subunit IV